MLGVKVFEERRIQRDFGYRISAADFFNDFIYIGDEKGNIYKYPIRTEQSQILQKSIKDDPRPVGTRSRIDKIIAYPETNTILVQSDEKLFVFDTALNKPQIIKERVHDFSTNTSFGLDCRLGVVVITKKKEVCVLHFNSSFRKYEQAAQKTMLSELPLCIGYTKSHLILGFKKEYQIMNLADNFSIKKTGIENKQSPYVKVVGPDEVMFFQDIVNMCIFMTTEGTPRDKNPLILNNKSPIVDISLTQNFCFFLFESGLVQIYNTYDPKQFVLVQTVNARECKGVTNGKAFTYSRESLNFLYEVSYKTQVKILIEKCAVDEALMVLKQNVGEDSKRIEQTKLDAIWPLIRKLKFQKAREIIKELHFDIRELILLFPEFISVNQVNMKPQKTMALFISEFVEEKQLKSREDSEKEKANEKKKAKFILKEVLEFKREKYIADSGKQPMKEKINFPSSTYSLAGVKLQAATTEEILEVIDFALIKWYLEMAAYKNLEDFLKNNTKIFCKGLFSEFEADFRSSKLKEWPTLVPRLYAAFGKIDMALENWQRVSETKDEAKAEVACQQAVKILISLEDRERVTNNLKWILRRRADIGMKLFSVLPENFFPYDQMTKYFETVDYETDGNCLERYLEILVLEKNTDEERMHTKLALKYLDNLFKIRRKDSKEQVSTPEYTERFNKFKKFLEDKSSKYGSEIVLDKIRGCEWLLDQEIYLYSREKKHDEALKKLIWKEKFEEAQLYCERNHDDTLTKYFTKLIELYERYTQEGKDTSRIVKNDILKFLRKYASHSELDPIKVLQLIPSDWLLNEEKGTASLYEFLESAISHTLHQKRSLNSAKYLSEMDLLNVEYSLAKAKKASLRFTLNKKCAVCNKPIGDKIFVVFPNAVVCHQNQACIKKDKYTICPVTGQDFQRTFRG